MRSVAIVAVMGVLAFAGCADAPMPGEPDGTGGAAETGTGGAGGSGGAATGTGGSAAGTGGASSTGGTMGAGTGGAAATGGAGGARPMSIDFPFCGTGVIKSAGQRHKAVLPDQVQIDWGYRNQRRCADCIPADGVPHLLCAPDAARQYVCVASDADCDEWIRLYANETPP